MKAVLLLAALLAVPLAAVPAYAQANAQVVQTDMRTLHIDFALEPDAVSAGEPAKMKIDFVNPSTERVQAHIDYEIAVSADGGGGAPVKSIPLTHTSSGSVSIPIEFESDGPHTVQIGVRGILFQPIPLETASLGLTIGGGGNGGGGGAERAGDGARGEEGPIPEWVRAIFAYYADGMITDAEMLAAIQYLADQGLIRIGPVQDAATAMSEEARWAADEAEYVDAIADRLRDDMRAFRIQLHAGSFIPGEPADYEDAFEASRAEIAAAKAYADVLRSAAADGRITHAEQAAIDGARLVAEDAEEATYTAILATPMASELELSDVMDRMTGGAGLAEQGGAPQGSPPAPAPQPPVVPRSVETAAEASDEADYLFDLAENRRKNLRNFELGLAGSDYRTTGDFGSAGSSAAYAANGNIAVYNPLIDAIREAIRAGERLAGILEDAASDGKLTASESSAIAGAEAKASEAGRAAAAAYDATSYAQDYQHGTFAAFMDGFR